MEERLISRRLRSNNREEDLVVIAQVALLAWEAQDFKSQDILRKFENHIIFFFL